MILVCELSFLGRSHVPFNAGLLATIHAAFPKKDLCFYGAGTHVEELKKEATQALAGSVSWREICPPHLETAYFKRFLRELSILRRLFRTLRRDSTSRLVLTSAHPSTVLALKVARWMERRQIHVQVVLHGMSGVVGKRFKHPIRRFQDMKTALTLFNNRGIQYLVLERSIRDVVVKNFPSISMNMEVLDHPISPKEGATQTIGLSEPIRFAFLGLADKAKGFPVFVELANDITKKYGSRVEFHAIGHGPVNVSPVKAIEVLATKPCVKHRSRADFIQSISSLHFVVLPHDAGSYLLTASGVLLDAIAWEKPVIARKIPIFEAMFEKHGDIGYLFSDDLELRYIIEEILQTADKSRYHRQVLNLGSARKLRTPESLATSYRQLCGAS